MFCTLTCSWLPENKDFNKSYNCLCYSNHKKANENLIATIMLEKYYLYTYYDWHLPHHQSENLGTVPELQSPKFGKNEQRSLLLPWNPKFTDLNGSGKEIYAGQVLKLLLQP